jgi:hypothetical protein
MHLVIYVELTSHIFPYSFENAVVDAGKQIKATVYCRCLTIVLVVILVLEVCAINELEIATP